MTENKLKNFSINYFKNSNNSIRELKKRCILSLWTIIIFRIGSFIPIPGINTMILSEIIQKQKGTIIEILNMFSGGALSRASIFALGIMPYITSSIIIHLLTTIHPKFIELKKDGEIGKQQINKYIRYSTLLLAILQSIGISTSLQSIPGIKELIINPGLLFTLTSIICLTTGTVFLMWLSEQITAKGIGNGISILIFTGILAGIPHNILYTLKELKFGNINIFSLLIILILIIMTISLVVFIENGQRKIFVHYAKRQQGRRIYISQNTHLPLKINMAGVIPAIFAGSVLLFPVTIISWIGKDKLWYWILIIINQLTPGHPLYIIIYSAAIMFFCFFYTSLSCNSRETAINLKNSGAFIPGIRPGEQTTKYIDKIMKKLTFIGSIYIIFICLLPEFMRYIIKAPFYFGGTSLLIVVIVIIDLISQIQSILLSKQYESVLKKTRFIKN